MSGTRLKVIGCATVIEEMLPRLTRGVAYQTLDFGLHVNPERLRATLQDAIDQSSSQADVILLGYGLCSNAVIGLRAHGCQLVVPRVDDCVGIFLGSRAAYRQQAQAQPGTYYLTKGWIEVGDSPFAEYDRMVQRHGPDRADRVIRLMLRHYTRLALINTGQYGLEKYREYARRMAERFGLHYEEIEGSTVLVQKMIGGPWDGEFVVVPPGHAVKMEAFLDDGPSQVTPAFLGQV